MRAWMLVLAALASLAAPASGSACSPVEGYVRPSNFELVQIADTIVIATAMSERNPDGRGWLDSKVKFRVRETLKGAARPELEVSAMRLGRIPPSHPDEITYAHPESHAGPCNRMTVSKGASYILFLTTWKGETITLGYPFSRVSEDYAGEDGTWTRIVRAYLSLQELQPPMARIERLESMRAEILAKPDPSLYEAALAGDIQTHLGSISPWKPTEFLLAAHADHKAGRPPRYPARDEAFDEEQSDAEAFAEAVMGIVTTDEPPPKSPLDPYEQRILNALRAGDHPAAMPLFEEMAKPDAPPEALAMAIRFFAMHGRYPEAWRLIRRAAAQMETAPEDAFHQLGWAIADAQQDPFHGDGTPRWRSDPAVAAEWPRMALRLVALSEQRFDGRLRFAQTLETLSLNDYRADPDLTLLRSGDSNDITDWATRELRNPENLRAGSGPAAGTREDPLLLPLQIALRWDGVSGDEDVPDIIRVFCLGPAQRQSIFRQWGELGGSQSALTILRLAASPDTDAADRAVLSNAIPAWDRRYQTDFHESAAAKDPALQKLSRGEPITAADIAPLVPAECPIRRH